VCNCGSSKQFEHGSFQTSISESNDLSTRQRQTPDPVHFQYTGRTGMTVIGPISGQRYRFEHPGALLAIDGRDAPSIVAVPHLQTVKTPQ
jgi:hypothetical protein